MLHRIISVLPCLVCLFWAAVIFICRSNRNRAKLNLACFMSVAVVLYLCHALFFLENYSALFDTLYIGANLSVYPLYLLYIKRLTSFEGVKPRDNMILVVPVAAVVLTATLYFLMPKADVAAFVDGYLYGQLVDFVSQAAAVQVIWHRTVSLIFAAEVVYTAIVGVKSIAFYNAELKRFYSSDNGRSLKSVRNLLLAFIATSVCSMAVNIIGKQFLAVAALCLAGCGDKKGEEENPDSLAKMTVGNNQIRYGDTTVDIKSTMHCNDFDGQFYYATGSSADEKMFCRLDLDGKSLGKDIDISKESSFDYALGFDYILDEETTVCSFCVDCHPSMEEGQYYAYPETGAVKKGTLRVDLKGNTLTATLNALSVEGVVVQAKLVGDIMDL